MSDIAPGAGGEREPRLTRRALAAGALATVVVALGPSHGVLTAPYGVARVSLPDFPAGNVVTGDATGAAWAQLLTTSTLLHVYPEGRVTDGLALAWSLSPDRTQLDLEIRPDALFTDATAITAADAAASIAFAKDAHAGSADAWRWEQVAGVEVIDRRVVRVSLTEPDASILALLASHRAPILPAAWIARGWDQERGPFPPASGCFHLESASSGRRRYQRNDGYFQVGRPHLGGVICSAPGEDVPRTTGLVTGDVDLLVDVPLVDVPTLRDDPGITLVGGPSNRLCLLTVNLARPLVSDARLRRLLSSAIDRQGLVEAAVAGEAAPAFTMIPAGHWAGFTHTIELVEAETVRAGLADLGVPPGIELRLVASDADPSLANAGVLLQEQLAWAGIALTLDLLDEAGMAAALAAGDWDLLLQHTGWWRDPHELVRPLLTSDGAANHGGYHNSRVDYLTGLAARARTTSYRAGFYQTVQQIVAEEAPVLPLYFPNYYDAMTNRLQSYPAFPPVSAAAMCQVTMVNPAPSQVP